MDFLMRNMPVALQIGGRRMTDGRHIFASTNQPRKHFLYIESPKRIIFVFNMILRQIMDDRQRGNWIEQEGPPIRGSNQTCGALATTHLTDYAQPADEDQVWSIWGGNARVKR